MKILILNRRDINNPLGGGAEVYTHEAAKGLARGGSEVTVFSSRFRGAEAVEEIDGITHVRRGNELTVHLWGFLFALRGRRRFDLIIDQFNGLGFFTFLVPGVRKMMLIHQMYREFWLRELGVPGILPYAAEPLLLRCYRKIPSVTVSESTRADLADIGFSNVRIVMNALSNKPLGKVPEKEDAPTVMFLGRLRSTKRPEDAVEIFRLLKAEVPEVHLWIAGSGPDENKVRERAVGLRDVTFFGRVGEQMKFELLSRAHLLLVPGVREGFGINVIEAASMGTPAVGYDIHGLRDSIRDGSTGLLARGPADAAAKAASLLRDTAKYRQMAENCLEYSKDFNWGQRASEFREAVLDMAAKMSS